MKRILLAIILSLLVFLTLSCKETTQVNAVKLGQEFQLAIGQAGNFSDADLKIKFAEVIEDSRCPGNVVCIWAGRVSCMFDITIDKETQKTALTQPGLSDMYTTEQYKQYTIKFRVEPYPMSGTEIKDSDYRLWLTVTKAP